MPEVLSQMRRRAETNCCWSASLPPQPATIARTISRRAWCQHSGPYRWLRSYRISGAPRHLPEWGSPAQIRSRRRAAIRLAGTRASERSGRRSTHRLTGHGLRAELLPERGQPRRVGLPACDEDRRRILSHRPSGRRHRASRRRADDISSQQKCRPESWSEQSALSRDTWSGGARHR